MGAMLELESDIKIQSLIQNSRIVCINNEYCIDKSPSIYNYFNSNYKVGDMVNCKVRLGNICADMGNKWHITNIGELKSHKEVIEITNICRQNEFYSEIITKDCVYNFGELVILFCNNDMIQNINFKLKYNIEYKLFDISSNKIFQITRIKVIVNSGEY